MSAFEKTDFLFKKTLGYVSSNGTNSGFGGENPGAAKPKIIPSLQIYSQSIPTTAPSDYPTGTNYSATIAATSNFNIGYKYTSTSYPYIVKYVLQLSQVDPNTSNIRYTSYRYADPSKYTNYLDNAIPGNYDITGKTYEINVYVSSTNAINNPTTTAISASSTSYPWVLDTDAGYLYFTSNNWIPSSLGNPWIVFYRYEGAVGLTPIVQF